LSQACPDEETLMAFVEGRQRDDARRSTAGHVDGCASCQEVVMAIAPALLSHATQAPPPPRAFDALAQGTNVGRYVVLSLVGRGGMGEVYAAYHPELDRKIALKLLHAGAGPDVAAGRARMLREAKAIARLSHPNVVGVHDAGTVGERVYIAMEFVDGRTVAEWLREQPRDWREVRDVFLASGRGLAAAHAAGIVHRDFKPHNVMVGRDGKVRVMDFGLASSSDDAPVEGAPGGGHGASVTETAALAGVGLTRTGVLLGTPAYMAPEQFRAEPADASTDQFSFCVSLFEGLYGERPFAGETVAALAAAVTAGKPRDPSQPGRAPAWLRRVIMRGLQRRREDRYPSMEALLDGLVADPVARTKRRAMWAALVVGVAAIVAGGIKLGGAERRLCQGAASRFTGIWDSAVPETGRRAAIHRAFAASGQGYAEQAFRGAARLVDEYVARWTSMYTDTCEATHVRGEQSAEVLDLRMACLNERLGNVRALAAVFSAADAKVVENAVNAAAALPALERCADVKLLQAVVKPPEDPATRRRVDELRGELAQLVALRDSGQCARATPAAEVLITKVRALGYTPLIAETLSAAAAMGEQCGDPALMIERYKEAHTAAAASRHDEIAAFSSTNLAFFAVNRTGELPLARLWLDVARGDVARLGREAYPTAILALDEGQLALADRQYDRALEHWARAHAMFERVLGPNHPWTVNIEMDQGDWLERAGRLEEALAVDKRLVARAEQLLGADHPELGLITNNLGEVLNLLGRYEDAEAAYSRAQQIFRKNGADRTLLAWVMTGIGRARIGQGDAEAAVAPLEEALAIREATKAPAAQLGETRFELARALWSRPTARTRALELADAARADLGGEPESIARIDAWLAQVRREKGPR
jgi:tetratricopeptide (TPR) repeat protein